MSGPLPVADLEAAYELIAQAVDRVGPGRERLFLAKLALALSHRLDDLDEVKAALAEATREID